MSIQGSGEHPTFPAQWLYGLWRDLPGETASIATVASGQLSPPKSLTPLRAPGPHAFAVRFSRDRQSQRQRPPQPAPRRDDGQRPSERDRMARNEPLIFPSDKAKYFLLWGLTFIPKIGIGDLPVALDCRSCHSGARAARARNPLSHMRCRLMDSLMCNCTSKLSLREPRNDEGASPATNWHDGQKFSLPETQITGTSNLSRPGQRGVRTSRTWGGDAVDAEAALDGRGGSVRQKRVVLAPVTASSFWEANADQRRRWQ